MIKFEFPGSKWWKFDFHTHTPASKDTKAWQLPANTVTPEDWLKKFMAAEIDCVAITDHNSGDWIDRLKQAYDTLSEQAKSGTNLDFRPLTLFPGVEISAHGGVHILAIFDPSKTGSTIDAVLSNSGFDVSQKGNTDLETSHSIPDILKVIHELGGIAIPAHIDCPKGLLTLQPLTLHQDLTDPHLIAVEQVQPDSEYPDLCHDQLMQMTKVLGSDCHNFRGSNVPGSCFTWVKMGTPNLLGLKLALLDGNGTSIIRSCENSIAYTPGFIPKDVITSIEVDRARYLGRNETCTLPLSPYFNTLVGGRGTGKSSFVHMLRLALQRENELDSHNSDNRPAQDFENFQKVSTKRGAVGALLPDTAIRINWLHDGQRLRIRWRPQDGNRPIVEEWLNNDWHLTASQSISYDRFPVKIFSQGQIATLSDKGRQTLLPLIDHASGADVIQQQLQEKISQLLQLGATSRSLLLKVNQITEVQRKLYEIKSKINVFSSTEHAETLKAYGKSVRQKKEIQRYIEQLYSAAHILRQCSENLLPDDWSQNLFSDANIIEHELISWRHSNDLVITELSRYINIQAEKLEKIAQNSDNCQAIINWNKNNNKINDDYLQLQDQLKKEGVSEPDAYKKLLQEAQRLQIQESFLLGVAKELDDCTVQYRNVYQELLVLRNNISQTRQNFLYTTLKNNPYVQIKVVPFGSDTDILTDELRTLLDIEDGAFANDFLSSTPKNINTGILKDWTLLSQEKNTSIEFKSMLVEKLKSILRLNNENTNNNLELSGRFKKRLQTLQEKPEFVDRVTTWFPEDDLDISYKRNNSWIPINQGSQGQRSAALLAFLLSFGEDPLILDQPEDDLDNHLIYDLIVQQIRKNKQRRQLLIATHNPNIVVNGDAEEVLVMDFKKGQCHLIESGPLQDKKVREEVCNIMEGGREALERRWKRLMKD